MSWLICGSTSVVPKEPKVRKIVFVPSDSTKLSDLFTKEAEESTNYVDELLESRFTTLELRIATIESYFKPLQALETLEHLEAPKVKSPTSPPEELTTVTSPPEELTTVTSSPPEELTTVTSFPPEELTTVISPPEELTTVTSFPPEELTTEEKPVLQIEEIQVEELTEEIKVEEPRFNLPSVVLPELVLDTKEVLANFFKTIHEEINHIEKNMNTPLPLALIEQLKRLSHDAKIPLPRSPRLVAPQLR